MAVEIKVPDINGILLKTKETYVAEDIAITIGIPTYDYSNTSSMPNTLEQYLQGELSHIFSDKVTKIAPNRFDKHTDIISVDFPNVTEIERDAFAECANLESINLPKLEKIGATAFDSCNKLPSKLIFENVIFVGANFLSSNKTVEVLSFPKMTTLQGRALYGANALKTIYLSNIEAVEDYGFYHAHVLTAIIMDNPNKVCELKSSANVFRYAYHYLGEVIDVHNPEGLQDGYIYVPDNLLEDYKTATNWSVFADRFKPLSEWDGE